MAQLNGKLTLRICGLIPENIDDDRFVMSVFLVHLSQVHPGIVC